VELTRQIYNRIKTLALTQIQAGARLRISQPDVSKLMNGRHSGYSVERLLALLNALEMDVDILVRPRAGSRIHRQGIVRVVEVA
jgi:predicted XRE-type DNA-binding protein